MTHLLDLSKGIHDGPGAGPAQLHPDMETYGDVCRIFSPRVVLLLEHRAERHLVLCNLSLVEFEELFNGVIFFRRG